MIHKNEVEAFAITTEKLPDGAIDKYYSYTLQTNDPKGDVQWNLLKDAQLRKGIEFDSQSGTLFGRPEEKYTPSAVMINSISLKAKSVLSAHRIRKRSAKSFTISAGLTSSSVIT